MFASYSSDLSMRDSIRCRDVLLSEWYQRYWPIKLQNDQNTKGLYENSKTGWRMATSVGGRATGMHPDFIAVDDPLNAQQAASEVELATVNEWWDSTMSTRGVSRDVGQVGIMQRLHFKDWSDHVMSKGTWEHIVLPMRYEVPVKDEKTGEVKARMKTTSLGWNDPRKEDGELLWPELFPEEKVFAMESTMGLYHSAGQLQQSPSPRGGGQFERAWFQIKTECPPLRRVIRYWDKASTEGGTGAESAGVALGEWEDPLAIHPAMRMKYIILDAIAFRERSAQREVLIKQTAAIDQSTWNYVDTWIEQEPGSGGKESAENTVANLAGFTCYIERVTGSKEVRAQPLASQSSVGKVSLLAGPWNRKFLDEIEAFPVGKLKDMVDAASGAFNKLFTPTGALDSASGLRFNKIDTDKMEVTRLRMEDF